MAPKRTSKLPPGGKKLPRQPRSTKGSSGSDSKKNKPSKEESGNSTKGETKMTLCTVPTASSVRPQPRERRPGRPPSSGKRMASTREVSGKVRSTYRRNLDPCDGSNDSGLGFDHHMDPHHNMLGMSDRVQWTGERTESKRPRLDVDIKLEQDEVNDCYGFPKNMHGCKESQALIRTAPTSSVPSLSISNNTSSSSGRAVPRCIPLSSRQSASAPVPLTTQLSNSSQYREITLKIIKQPEQQHRARYQTEGSRGAVKDREGNGFPVVQLTGYSKPATLQVFIGTDIGKVAPHMFYQACKVSGKNSTPCIEKKIDGTCVIELQLDPSKDMCATCDCVGILKERNVDVEHRFPDQLGNRSKKKSTRCRMIFRTTVVVENGALETLQVCSHPIVCTQPPGIPEICKKSLTSCPATGGLELFMFGKNFLKDTRVSFQLCGEDRRIRWEQCVSPDKEFLQQTHLVCVVPPFHRPDITEPVSVRLCVVSSGKTSEPHQFVYTPVNGVVPSVHMDPPPPNQSQFFNKILWPPSVSKREQDLDMMPPPESSMVPLSSRRSSISVPATNDLVHSPPLHALKQEYIDENSESSIIDPVELSQGRFRHISESSLDVHHGDSNMSMINDNSIDILRRNSLGADIMSQNVSENSNLSVTNDNSMDMVVTRNPLNRSVSVMCENSNVSLVNEDSTCSTTVRCNNSLLLSQPVVIHQKILAAAHNDISNASVEELKVMDLTMKMPMATVADLANTSAPSMATLQKFVTESSTDPLPAQSGQSVENFLTKIETKLITSPSVVQEANIAMKASNSNSQTITPTLNGDTSSYLAQKVSRQLIQNPQPCNNLLTTAGETMVSNVGSPVLLPQQEPVFLSSQKNFITGTTQSDVISMVAKSEAAAIAEKIEKIIPQPTVVSSNMESISTTIENRITTLINTEKLDALVNSTVESHMLSPKRSDKEIALSPPNIANRPNVMVNSPEALLASQTNLMVPPMVNTNLSSPTLSAQEVVQPQVSPNLSPEVILNSQISPSLMCRNSTSLQQDGILSSTALNNMAQASGPAVESNLMPSPVSVSHHSPVRGLLSASQSPNMPLHSPVMSNTMQLTESEALRKATQELLEAHRIEKGLVVDKGVEEKDVIMNKMMINNIMPSNAESGLPVTTGNNSLCPVFTPCSTARTVPQEVSKPDFPLPVPVKEISSNDKKTDDRMIPQSFTSLTENELINFINPSCFDQV